MGVTEKIVICCIRSFWSGEVNALPAYFEDDSRHSPFGFVHHAKAPVRRNRWQGIQVYFGNGVSHKNIRERVCGICRSLWTIIRNTLEEVEQKSGSNTDILLDIDVQGARQVMKTLQKAVTVFILPPSLEVLRTRLVERATDTTDEQERRFQKSQDEMRSYSEYQYTIRNETLEQAIEELQSVIVAERVRTTHIDAAHVFR